jgi:SAM-dependent methyltransferase
MPELMQRVIDYIGSADEKFGHRLKTYAEAGDALFHSRAETFFERYKVFSESQGKTFECHIDCFLHLQRSVSEQRARFLETGRYQNSSFDDVNRRVYSNPETMHYHMYGLVFAQFLWPDQYRRFAFFADHLPLYKGIKRYLEIGGGHALYLTEALNTLPDTVQFDLVDISPTSLEMAKGISRAASVEYHLMDIFDFPDEPVYDFITMGEVIEHVEQPHALVSKVRRLLAPGGVLYITTPANAPMQDHIYLFRNAQEIRDLLCRSGFRIEREQVGYAVPVSDKVAAQMKLPLVYAAFVCPGEAGYASD